MRFTTGLACGAAIACAAGTFLSAQTTNSTTPTSAVDSTVFSDLRPRAIGPATTSGRISALDGSADNPRLMYVGTAGGGVWKSVNGGTTFTPVFDEHVMSIGAIAIDQAKPDTERPYRVYGGLQDNGSWSGASRALGSTAIRNRDWINVGIGDGFNVFTDPRDPSTVFSEYQGGRSAASTCVPAK
jgi:hypothetical protein